MLDRAFGGGGRVDARDGRGTEVEHPPTPPVADAHALGRRRLESEWGVSKDNLGKVYRAIQEQMQEVA